MRNQRGRYSLKYVEQYSPGKICLQYLKKNNDDFLQVLKNSMMP